MKLCTRSLLLATGLLVFLAGPALAASSVYDDVLEIGNPQLGYVGAGQSISYTHNFAPALDPTIEIYSIDSVVLSIGAFDDSHCRRLSGCLRDWFREGELASIELDGALWQTGQATAQVFFGDVTAYADMLITEGELEVVVRSEHGDFVVAWSHMQTSYTWKPAGGGGGAGGTSPMPEPSAALVFAVGAVVMQRRVRQAVRERAA